MTYNPPFIYKHRTSDSDRLIYGSVTSVMQFVVPFIIMAFAYTKVFIIIDEVLVYFLFFLKEII